MTDRAHMPNNSSLPNLLCFEDLIAAQSDGYRWPVFSEDTASSLCYTSGTTGNPKGRALQPSLNAASQLGRGYADWLQRLGYGVADRADVPRQRLGHALHSLHGGVQSWCFQARS